jgi:hypothetical protein
MKEKELVAMLRRAHGAAIQRLPNWHTQRTAQCPSIPTLIKGRFTEEQRVHVRNCNYCLKVRALGESLAAAA